MHTRLHRIYSFCLGGVASLLPTGVPLGEFLGGVPNPTPIACRIASRAPPRMLAAAGAG